MRRLLAILLSLVVMTANADVVHWTGGAPAIRQVTTLTVANTWATNDTATVTIGGKSLVVTVGTSATTAAVATDVAEAIDATSETSSPLGAGYKRSAGGQTIPEFVDVDAEAVGSIVYVSAVEAGVPVTITSSESTAGTGTIVAATATAATGPNFLDNPANYTDDTLPEDDDDLYIDQGDVDILYGLSYFFDNDIDLKWVVTNDYTGQIGLPPTRDASPPYAEYRLPRYLNARGFNHSFSLLPGLSGNTTGRKLWISFSGMTGMNVNILAKRGSANGTAPTVFIAGADNTTFTNKLTIASGCVAVEPRDANSQLGFEAAFSSIDIGGSSSSTTDPIVTFGPLMNWAEAANGTRITGGTVFSEATPENATDFSNVTITGGSLEIKALDPAADSESFTVYKGGTLYLSSNNNFAEIVLFGGTFNSSRVTSGLPATDTGVIRAYAGSVINDPKGVFVDEVHCIGCKPTDITLDLAPNQLLEISSPATP